MQPPTPPLEDPPKIQAPAKKVALEELMGTDRELQLVHNHQVYRLRLTKANKLILTK